MVFLCCGGPILIIIGAVALAMAASDPRGRHAASYNAAVVAWSAAPTGGGYQFNNAFPTAPVLNVTFPVRWAAITRRMLPALFERRKYK